jgi:crotonobetainyl-CoA:carnitine CoA-transferase CaiB-like acyl-CoA transferase
MTESDRAQAEQARVQQRREQFERFEQWLAAPFTDELLEYVFEQILEVQRQLRPDYVRNLPNAEAREAHMQFTGAYLRFLEGLYDGTFAKAALHRRYAIIDRRCRGQEHLAGIADSALVGGSGGAGVSRKPPRL